MISVQPFFPRDAREMEEQEATKFIQVSDAQLEKMQYGMVAFTVRIDQRVVACFGAVEHWPGREEAWVLFDWRAGRHFVALVKIIRRELNRHPVARMEATCERAFKPAHRLLQLLGFELETDCIKSYLFGRDFSMYRRLSNG